SRQSHLLLNSFSYCFQLIVARRQIPRDTTRVSFNRRCCSFAKTQPTVLMQAHCRESKPEPHGSTLQAGGLCRGPLSLTATAILLREDRNRDSPLQFERCIDNPKPQRRKDDRLLRAG